MGGAKSTIFWGASPEVAYGNSESKPDLEIGAGETGGTTPLPLSEKKKKTQMFVKHKNDFPTTWGTCSSEEPR